MVLKKIMEENKNENKINSWQWSHFKESYFLT